jgi:TM2 domain-containing membrane protein YozV
MFCGQCGANNVEGSRFCDKCGNKLIQTTAAPESIPTAPAASPLTASTKSSPPPPMGNMSTDKLDLFLMANGKNFPAKKTPILRDALIKATEAQMLQIQSTELKNPTTMFIISFFVGALGVDRFMLGQTGMGMLKLLTGGVCGILALIDWITIMKRTRQYNFDKVMAILGGVGIGGFQTATANNVETAPQLSDRQNPTAKNSEHIVKTSESTSNIGTYTQTAPIQAIRNAYAPSVTIAPTTSSVLGDGEPKSPFDNLIPFIQAFVKEPFTTIQNKYIGFIVGIIIVAATAFVFGLLNLRLGRGFGSYYSYQIANGISSFLGAFFEVLFAPPIVALLSVFWGKIIFKSEFDFAKQFKRLFASIAVAEIPLLALTVVSLAIPAIVPALFNLGLIAIAVLGFAVTTQMLKLSADKSVYVTILSYAGWIYMLSSAISSKSLF